MDSSSRKSSILNHKDPCVIRRKFQNKGVIPIRGKLPYTMSNDDAKKAKTRREKRIRDTYLRFFNMNNSNPMIRNQLSKLSNVYYKDDNDRDYSKPTIINENDSLTFTYPYRNLNIFDESRLYNNLYKVSDFKDSYNGETYKVYTSQSLVSGYSVSYKNN